ncbi:hypothetical protein [Sinorhizobium fredii]|uniref:hypothetical protein n=1 Tax=Rhizobium fredii TaxID=380 RepID=UPI0005610912|nr:hypothetical protein [Sinorhizobium fredii]
MAPLFTPIVSAVGGLGGMFSTIMPIVSGVGTIAGGMMQAQGQRQAAAAQKANLDYQAKQLEMQGKEELAASQHDAFQQRREKELALSALQARGAASGFETTDPTGLQIGEDIEKYGTLQEMMAMYGGRSRRAGLEAEAVGRRAEGAAAVQGAKSAAMGTILGGLTSGFSRFAQYEPPIPNSAYRYGGGYK